MWPQPQKDAANVSVTWVQTENDIIPDEWLQHRRHQKPRLQLLNSSWLRAACMDVGGQGQLPPPPLLRVEPPYNHSFTLIYKTQLSSTDMIHSINEFRTELKQQRSRALSFHIKEVETKNAEANYLKLQMWSSQCHQHLKAPPHNLKTHQHPNWKSHYSIF